MPSSFKDITILHTKLHRPPLTPDLIARNQLQDRLEEGRVRPLTLVVAPTGYGKSTLVSAWLESSAFQSSWISLDESSNEFIIFLKYIFSAIGLLYPNALELTEKVLNTRDLPTPEKVAEIVLNDLNDIGESFSLVLDDFDHMRDVQVNKFIQTIIRFPVQSLNLVIISRKDPNLPLFELRAGNKMNELRTRDLQFTQEEVISFFEQIYNDRPDSGFIQQINKKIEVGRLRYV
jgi:LuxR family maltose regulon positive regulatory protein